MTNTIVNEKITWISKGLENRFKELKLNYRENMISQIEGICGTFNDMPWNLINTKDLEKLLNHLAERVS